MIRAIIQWSLHFRIVVLVLAGVVIAAGFWLSATAKLDVFPEFAPPQVVIQTEAPGFAPEQVEMLVTQPIEFAVNGVGNLDFLRSESIQGLSVVTAIFQEGTDILKARQLVSERLTQLSGRMPVGVKSPAMAPLTSSTGIVLVMGLTSATRSPMDLRTTADWVLHPQLLGVPGVAKVVVYGGEIRQLQVRVHPARLVALGLSLQDVLMASRQATGIRGAGFVEGENQRILIRTEGQALEPGVLRETVITMHGAVPVRLGDVADVVEGPEPKTGDASIMGQPGVMLVISKQPGVNTLELTGAVERVVENLQPLLRKDGITLHPRLFRPASFINTALHGITTSLLQGGLLVAAVLFLFLFNVRTAVISLTAIPLSLLGAVLILRAFDVTLNTMTIGGLAIAIGEVVDDAIIDVENIFRRLKENRALREPFPVMQVIFHASVEVRSAVVYATFVVALVFLPVLTLSGVHGKAVRSARSCLHPGYPLLAGRGTDRDSYALLLPASSPGRAGRARVANPDSDPRLLCPPAWPCAGPAAHRHPVSSRTPRNSRAHGSVFRWGIFP